MRRVASLLLVFLLPAFLLPAGASICICDLLGGRHGMESCSTCHVTCCGHSPRNDASIAVQSVVTRDCFLHIPASEPADDSVAKHADSWQDHAKPVTPDANAVPPFVTMPDQYGSSIRRLAGVANLRAASTPLSARALPLRL